MYDRESEDIGDPLISPNFGIALTRLCVNSSSYS